MANKKPVDVPEAAPAVLEPNELVDVIDKNGVRTRVGRAWLERWPDDFEVVDENFRPVSETPEPQQATGTPNGPVAQPVKE